MLKLVQSVKSAVFGPRSYIRLAEHSHVECPLKGRVSVDECLSCDRLRDAKLDGDDQWVACAAADHVDHGFMYRPLY